MFLYLHRSRYYRAATNKVDSWALNNNKVQLNRNE